VTSRQDPVVRAWWTKKVAKEKEEDDRWGLKIPGMSFRYMELETAAHFGMGLDDFLLRPVERRAEMIGHVIIRSQREAYMMDVAEKRAKKKGDDKSGRNPTLGKLKSWGLS
jgi:hypothetical protein